MGKTRKLSGKQKLFVEYYLQTWNATRAAEMAGYSGSYATLRSIGSENLTKPNIQEQIQERMSSVAMESDEVLARLADMARSFDITEYVELRETYAVNSKGDEYFSGYALKIDFKALQADGYGHLIKKIKQNGSGGIEIEWHDQMAALVHVGKHHKLFTDSMDLTSGGRALEIKVVYADGKHHDPEAA